MADLDTHIPGSPASVRAAASWLRSNLHPNLDAVAEQFNKAGLDAEEFWTSEAGREFREAMTRGDQRTGELAEAVRAMADDLDAFAHSLELCQNDMSDARTAAFRTGLTVNGFIIVDPGPLPASPLPPQNPDPAAQAQYDTELAAWEQTRARFEAFGAAATEVDRVHRQYAAAGDDLARRYDGFDHASWMVSQGEIAMEGLAAGAAAHQTARVNHFTRMADDFVTRAQAAIADMEAHPNRFRSFRGGGFNPLNWMSAVRESPTLQRLLPTVPNQGAIAAQAAHIDDLLNQGESALNRATAAADDALPGRLGGAGRALGAAGLALGIYSDYMDGEDTVQIVASQGGSFVAGMAAGAAIGTMIPVPVVGTVAGALVGGVVSIFADGAIDSLFEEGPDVGAAFEAGVDALADVGSAIGSFFGGD